jgi:hypothetical protein
MRWILIRQYISSLVNKHKLCQVSCDSACPKHCDISVQGLDDAQTLIYSMMFLIIAGLNMASISAGAIAMPIQP